MDWNSLADRTLAGHEVSADEALSVLRSSDDELLPLLHAAFRLRERASRPRRADPRPPQRQERAVPRGLRLLQPVGRASTPASSAYQLQTVEELVEGAREAHAHGRGQVLHGDQHPRPVAARAGRRSARRCGRSRPR